MKSRFIVTDETEKNKSEYPTPQHETNVEQDKQNINSYVNEDEYLKVIKTISKDINSMKENLNIITGVVIFNIITMIIAVIIVVFMTILS